MYFYVNKNTNNNTRKINTSSEIGVSLLSASCQMLKHPPAVQTETLHLPPSQFVVIFLLHDYSIITRGGLVYFSGVRLTQTTQ